MPEKRILKKPWLVGVWPGMGNVALSAGYYLMAKLGMHVAAEFSPRDLFEVEHVEVNNGLIRTGRLPRSRFFAWSDPREEHDVVVFIGEAQPATGKYAFCHKLIDYAKEIGVERVFTFAAMATQMHPQHRSRVFGAATDATSLEELKRLELEIIDDGHISGLNGVLLGVAAEAGLRGTCLLGEMPHVFAQLPFPNASLAVLEVFTAIARIELDLTELNEQAQATQQRLGELLAQVEQVMEQRQAPTEDEFGTESFEPPGLSAADQRRIDHLFAQAKQDRSKAYELKRELDRLDVFADYEDRFLDLFKKPE